MANKYRLKWGIGLLSVTMFSYFFGLTQYLDRSNSPVPVGNSLNQSNLQTSNSDNVRNEWNASQDQFASGNNTSPVLNTLNGGQNQQNYSYTNNGQGQGGNSYIARSRAS